MQIKIFSIPIVGGENLIDEMNVFLRSHKVLRTEKQLVNNDGSAFWSFCVSYLKDSIVGGDDKEKVKVDYKQVLDEETFKRFSRYREIRKQAAQADSVPPYIVFTDEELANLAKIGVLTAANMKTVVGVGPKKVEKYGHHFITASISEQVFA